MKLNSIIESNIWYIFFKAQKNLNVAIQSCDLKDCVPFLPTTKCIHKSINNNILTQTTFSVTIKMRCKNAGVLRKSLLNTSFYKVANENALPRYRKLLGRGIKCYVEFYNSTVVLLSIQCVLPYIAYLPALILIWQNAVNTINIQNIPRKFKF